MKHNYALTRWIFLRLLGVIYLIAFVSLWVQIEGLIGSKGILPFADFLNLVEGQIGGERYRLVPTLLWLNSSDTALHIVCGAGTLLSILLIIDLIPPLTLFLLWLCYLSLTSIGQVFLSFQWDVLLLETGFLAIFFAPWQFWPRFSDVPTPRLPFLWLLRLLLFKLMFLSGAVKLLSGDPNWRNLTALNFHYETQPLPTWIGWYAHQLPGWFQQSSVAIMFIIELGAPFLIFAPRRWRFGGCVALVSLQVLILLTGNYTFFNYLTIVLCLLLLDDTLLRHVLPKRWADLFAPKDGPASQPAETDIEESVTQLNLKNTNTPLHPRTPAPLHTFIIPAFVVILFLLSAFQITGTVLPQPTPIRQVLRWIAPFRSINSYGLFAVMTTSRPEIIIEGSNDGETWLAYEFKWKPGDLQQRPRFVAPHQPRLDWQMWFAALSSYQRNSWLINFMMRLSEGSPQVVGLLKTNPFPDNPPRFVRAVVYDYQFTDFGSNAWWQRGDPQILYTPVQ